MVILALAGMIHINLKAHMAAMVDIMMMILMLQNSAVLVVVDLPMVGQLVHLLMMLQVLKMHLKNYLKLNFLMI